MQGSLLKFLGSLARNDEASFLLIGAPFDGTSSFFPGSRMAPVRIREASHGLETYSPVLDRCLEDAALGDFGDLDLPIGNTPASLELIEAACREALERGMIPIVVGGEHLVSLPAIRACAARYDGLAVIHFDAHADLREEYLGEHDSHATVMRRVGEVIGSESIFHIGIRSGTREEFQYAREASAGLCTDVLAGARQAAKLFGDRPVYVTIDVDVVDPGYAPGTGTPEPGGCSPGELFEAIYALAGLDVVGLDVVEVNPTVDVGVTTSILGAKVIREAVLTLSPLHELWRSETEGDDALGG